MSHTAGRCLVAVLVLAALHAVPALAQVDLERFERQLEQIRREARLIVDDDVPADQRLLIDYGAYLSFNFFAIDDLNQNTHILRQTDLTGYFKFNLDNVHDVLIRGHTRYDDFNTGEDFDGHGDDWTEPTLDRAVYRFDLTRYLASYQDTLVPWQLTFQGGRQLVHWANGLVLSEELDGVLVSFEQSGLGLTGLAGITRESITDIDSSRPDFDGDTQRAFFGGMVQYELGPQHRPFVYGLVQRDWNESDFGVVGGVATEFEYNSWYLGFGSQGSLTDQLLYSVEMAYEGGNTLSDPLRGPQQRDPIQAFAADFQLDYLLLDANRSRLTAEVILATGDDDRLTTTNTFGGNQPGTKDNAFNSFGLLNTGLAFSPNVSNVIITRLGASSFPFASNPRFNRLQVGVNLFVYNKFDSAAPIDEPTNTDSYIGIEPDLFLNWQITSDLSLAMRYGVFFPGEAIQTDKDPRHFFFTGVTLAF